MRSLFWLLPAALLILSPSAVVARHHRSEEASSSSVSRQLERLVAQLERVEAMVERRHQSQAGAEADDAEYEQEEQVDEETEEPEESEESADADEADYSEVVTPAAAAPAAAHPKKAHAKKAGAAKKAGCVTSQAGFATELMQKIKAAKLPLQINVAGIKRALAKLRKPAHPKAKAHTDSAMMADMSEGMFGADFDAAIAKAEKFNQWVAAHPNEPFPDIDQLMADEATQKAKKAAQQEAQLAELEACPIPAATAQAIFAEALGKSSDPKTSAEEKEELALIIAAMMKKGAHF